MYNEQRKNQVIAHNYQLDRDNAQMDMQAQLHNTAAKRESDLAYAQDKAAIISQRSNLGANLFGQLSQIGNEQYWGNVAKNTTGYAHGRYMPQFKAKGGKLPLIQVKKKVRM